MWRVVRPDAVSVVNDKQVRRSLARYFDVMENKKLAKFVIAKRLSASYDRKDSTEKLWQLHENLTREYLILERKIDSKLTYLEDLETPTRSFLDLKIELASRILSCCHFCSRKCGTNRAKGELGYCKCDTQMTTSTMFQHMGEEPELVPSGTIFTQGCTMCCRHCQNWTISQWFEKGEVYTCQQLAAAVERLRNSGCRNINLVGGEPTPWIEQWLETFRDVNVNVPVVWNSNSYYSEETAKLLGGFVDVYLLDFKYGASECAKRISDAPDYWDACIRNHIYGKKFGELLVRVLVLPGHLDCCAKPIINWMAQNLGSATRINVMFQYRPEWRAFEIPELGRRLTKEEMAKAMGFAKEAGFINFIM
ncbi:MAG TPA: radical SAM protein [Candidatus Bathyarchaeia archaeon]|nr:radical SAM protein [Candidatus Bathyarchaeia archaeon]